MTASGNAIHLLVPLFSLILTGLTACSGKKGPITAVNTGAPSVPGPADSGPTLATSLPPPPIYSPIASPVVLPPVTDPNTQNAFSILQSVITTLSFSILEHSASIGLLEGESDSQQNELNQFKNRITAIEAGSKPYCYSEVYDGPVGGTIPVKYYRCKNPSAVMRDCYSFFAPSGESRCGTYVVTSSAGMTSCFTGGCGPRSGQSWRVQLLCCDSTVNSAIYSRYDATSGVLLNTYPIDTPPPQ